MNSKTFIIVFLVILIFGFGIVNASDWPMFQHDFDNTGYTNAKSNLNIKDINLLWTFKADDRLTTPIAVDINNDGYLEVIVGSMDRNLYVLDYTGKELWVYQAGSGISSIPSAADMNNDDRIEIGFGSMDQIIHLLDSNGNEIWNYKTDEHLAYKPIKFYDVNKDGFKEILIGNTILDYNKKRIKDSRFYTDSKTARINDTIYGNLFCTDPLVLCPSEYIIPSLGDVNNDGKIEIVFWGKAGNILTKTWMPIEALASIVKNREILYLFNLSGDTIWKYTISKIGPAGLADLDGDNYLEIIFGEQDGYVHILDHKGHAIWHHEVDGIVETGTAIADLNRDGKLEIISTTYNGSIFVFGSTEDLNNNGIFDFMETTTTTTSTIKIVTTTIPITTIPVTTLRPTTTTTLGERVIYQAPDYTIPAIILAIAIVLGAIILRYKK